MVLDSISIRFVVMYFDSEIDCLNLIMVAKKYRTIYTSFKYNPVPIHTTKLFANTTQQHLYSKEDKQINNIPQYVIHYQMTYSECALSNNNNTKYKNVIFKQTDLKHYKKSQPTHQLNDQLITCTLPNNITKINERCFHNFKMLTSIELPKTVTRLGDKCFEGCENLESIVIHSSLTSVGQQCFQHCSKLTSITIPNATKFVGKLPLWVALLINKQGIDCLNIEYSSDDAMKYKTKLNLTTLTSIEIPTIVNSLGSSCFYGFEELQSITIPNKVTTIESNCFRNCSSLSNIQLPSCVTSLGAGCFFNCIGLVGTFYLPTHLIEIGVDCFRNCSRIESFNTPNTITKFGRSCFEKCSCLENFVTPTSLKSLSRSCFEKCVSLKQIVLSPTITHIGDGCFYNCTSLSSINVNHVQRYDRYCFGMCGKLQTNQLIPLNCFNPRKIK